MRISDWSSDVCSSDLWYVVLVLPVLFTAGMTLVDTLDGVIMHHAYAWAFARPVRKIYYNLTINIISVAIAFLVGGVGLTTLVAKVLHVESGSVGWIAGFNLEKMRTEEVKSELQAQMRH